MGEHGEERPQCGWVLSTADSVNYQVASYLHVKSFVSVDRACGLNRTLLLKQSPHNSECNFKRMATLLKQSRRANILANWNQRWETGKKVVWKKIVIHLKRKNLGKLDSVKRNKHDFHMFLRRKLNPCINPRRWSYVGGGWVGWGMKCAEPPPYFQPGRKLVQNRCQINLSEK